MEKQAQKEVEEFGNAIMDEVIDHVEKQDLGWEPLSVATIARKGMEYAYVDRGEFVSNIELEIKRTPRTIQIRVGPSRRKHYSGVSFQELAAYLEYGTTTIPARPLWRPSFERVKKNAKWQQMLDAITQEW